MGILSFFGKKKEVAKPRLEFPSKAELEVPPPPPMVEPKEEEKMPAFKEDIEVPPPVAVPEGPTSMEEKKEEEFLPFKEKFPEEPEEPKFEELKPTKAPGTLEAEPVSEEAGEIEEVYQIPKKRKPIFVKIETFKQILSEIRAAKVTLKESENNLTKVIELKSVADKEFDKWHGQVNEVQKRLTQVDRVLFK